MGLRFQRVLRIFPWLRINVSKGGLSGSVGPRGADVNFGRRGVTTNAGIPGTGISYRSRLGGHGGKIGVLALVAALGFAAFKNADRIGALFQHPPTSVAGAAKSLSASKTELKAQRTADAAAPASGIRYVHRGGSDLRDLSSHFRACAEEGVEGHPGRAAGNIRAVGASARWQHARLDAARACSAAIRRNRISPRHPPASRKRAARCPRAR